MSGTDQKNVAGDQDAALVGPGQAAEDGREAGERAVDPAVMARLVERLREIAGPEHVYTHPHQTRTYESDGLLQYKVTPAAVVLPIEADQVRAIVRACYEAEVPWVARGAGSGLSGGALPVENGVLIAVSRMRRVLDVDVANQRVTVEPGVTNVEVSQAVAAAGHFYPPDPSSQIVCSIGGNVAENSGGAHCFKYGFTTNYVTGLEVVLSDGEVVQLGGKELERPGYDLLGAFVGSEGTLGIATKITVRITPSPEAVKTMVAFFDSTADAGSRRLGDRVRGRGPRCDRDDGPARDQGIGGSHRRRLPRGRGRRAGHRAGRLEGRMRGPLRRRGAPLRELRGERGAGRAVGGRAPDDVEGAQGGVRGDGPGRDQLLRPGRRDPAHQAAGGDGQIASLADEYGMQVANVFHAGDGNLHPLVCYEGDENAERAEELSAKILQVCVDAGGSITGEHGVGFDKKRYMKRMFEEPDLEAFQKLRCAWDPAGLANPGKVMPTPRLCGEVPGPYRQHPLERAGLAERF